MNECSRLQVSITAAARALAQGLSRAVAEALSSAHAPDEFFEVRPQLPMTANGKIDSKALLKLLEDAPTLEVCRAFPNHFHVGLETQASCSMVEDTRPFFPRFFLPCNPHIPTPKGCLLSLPPHMTTPRLLCERVTPAGPTAAWSCCQTWYRWRAASAETLPMLFATRPTCSWYAALRKCGHFLRTPVHRSWLASSSVAVLRGTLFDSI